MLSICIIGLLLGILIPSVASRFGKVLPADPGMILVTLWHKPCFTKSSNPLRMEKLKKMWKKFFFVSFLWGVVTMFSFAYAHIVFKGSIEIFSYVFIYVVFLLMSIDKMYYLLPDFFTIPLLMLGFTFVWVCNNSISMTDALVGAWYGYFVSVLSVVVMSFFKSAEFGAGDAKMLTALGAWLGLVGLSMVIVLSFVFFALEAFVYRRRTGAFGPALGTAAIIVFFVMFK